VSQQYAEILSSKAYQIPAKYIPLPTTNHWFVLSSRELKEALEKEVVEAAQKEWKPSVVG
jgi:hypothetical protein